MGEEQYLLDKTFYCSVCGESFKSKTVKAGKAVMIDRESDLRPVYRGIDVIKYEVMVCPNCGYASIARYFGKTSVSQNKWIKNQISERFNGFKEPETTYSYEDSLWMHKHALRCAEVKRAKNSEKAFTCLKIAWLYRGKKSQEEDEARRAILEEQELTYIGYAYDMFSESFTSENFPIAGMDEFTFNYLMGDLGRQLRKYEEARRWVGKNIISTTALKRVKDSARNLKERINEEEQEYKASLGEQ